MQQCKAMKKKIGNSWGVRGLYMTLQERKFQGGGGGSNRKNHPWGGMDIFWNHAMFHIYQLFKFSHVKPSVYFC